MIQWVRLLIFVSVNNFRIECVLRFTEINNFVIFWPRFAAFLRSNYVDDDDDVRSKKRMNDVKSREDYALLWFCDCKIAFNIYANWVFLFSQKPDPFIPLLAFAFPFLSVSFYFTRFSFQLLKRAQIFLNSHSVYFVKWIIIWIFWLKLWKCIHCKHMPSGFIFYQKP